MKRIICIALLWVMIIGVVPANAKTPKISEYLETSFDVYNVPIVDSYTEFKEMIDNKKIKPAIEDGGSNILYTISAKQNGCIVLYGKDNFQLITIFHYLMSQIKQLMKYGEIMVISITGSRCGKVISLLSSVKGSRFMSVLSLRIISFKLTKARRMRMEH